MDFTVLIVGLFIGVGILLRNKAVTGKLNGSKRFCCLSY